MVTALILVIATLVFCTSAYLYRAATGEPVWRINMVSYAFMLLIAIAFMGSTLIALDKPWLGYDPPSMRDHYMGETDPRMKVWGMVMWMFIGMPLGGVIVNAIAGGKTIRERMLAFRESPVVGGLGMSRRTLFWVVLTASVIAGAFNMYYRPETSALTAVLSGEGVVGGQVVRRASVYGSQNLVVSLLFNVATLTMLNLIAFAMALETKALRWRVLFLSGLAIIAFLAVSRGTVSDIGWYLLGLGVTRSMMGGPFVRPVEGVAVAALIGVMFSFFKGYADFSLTEVLGVYVRNRLVYSQLFGSYLAFDVFPRHQDFLLFSSTGRIIHDLLHLPFNESYGIVLMQFYNWEGVQAGSAGHMTTNFMGEAWSNFGWVGVVLAPLWVGGVVQCVHRWFIARERSAVHIGIYAYLATSFGYASDLIGFYYPLGTISAVGGLVAVLWGIKWIMTGSARWQRHTGESTVAGAALAGGVIAGPSHS